MPPPPGVSQGTHIRMKITPTQTGHDQGWQVVNTKHGNRKVLIPQDAPDADGKVVVYAPIAEPEPEELLAPAPAPGPEPAPETSMLPGVPAAGQRCQAYRHCRRLSPGRRRGAFRPRRRAPPAPWSLRSSTRWI